MDCQTNQMHSYITILIQIRDMDSTVFHFTLKQIKRYIYHTDARSNLFNMCVIDTPTCHIQCCVGTTFICEENLFYNKLNLNIIMFQLNHRVPTRSISRKSQESLSIPCFYK